MKKLIVIADWAADSLSCQEVRSSVEGFLDNPSHPNISFVNTTPATIHTAFQINQIVETEEEYGRPLETVIFQASDSVQDNPPEKSKTWGKLCIIRLKSGLHIIGPNTGYVFSFIKDKIEEVFYYPGLPESGSFRARDTFARVVAHVMDAKQDDLDLEEAHTNAIPELQDYYVGHIDSFGNIITTIPESAIEEKHLYGHQIEIHLNGETKTVEYVKNLFDSSLNNLVIYPGTTGKKDDPYMEISKYIDISDPEAETGFEEFEHPVPGEKITFE